MHAYSIHRDPRNFFPHPEGFWPERWLLASSESQGQDAPEGFVHNDQAFIPFSYGPMSCVGKGLALQQMRMVVVALMQRFRIFVPGKGKFELGKYEKAYKDFFVSVRMSLPVVLEPREGPAVE